MSPESTPESKLAPAWPGMTGALGTTLLRGLLGALSPAGTRGKLSILLFHRIARAADPLAPDTMQLAHFERLLDFLDAHTHVLSLREASAALGRGTLPARAVALTFDDGYADWLDTVAPALRRRAMHATFFVATEQLDGARLWHERIIAAVRALPDTGAALPYGFGAFHDLRQTARRAELSLALQQRLKYLPLDERLPAIAALEAQAVAALAPPAHFDAAAVRALHNMGFEIGAHTVRHPILRECNPAEARAEIGGARERLEHITGAPVTLFAYPNGKPGRDYSLEHVELVKACGYQAALTTSTGAAGAHSDRFQLPRLAPWGDSDASLAYQLARNLLTRAQRLRTAPAPVRALLIASTFAPTHGGSAVVYENLCLQLPPGAIRVLAPRRDYLNHSEIDGWRQHDAAAPYPIDRIGLLRPPMLAPPANTLVALARLAWRDAPLYANCLWHAARLVRRHRINTIIAGELVTGSWLALALRALCGCRVLIYVHGEEVTTATGGLHGRLRANYLLRADKVVAVSAFTCDALTALMQVPAARIALIPNGVDTRRFTPAAPCAALIARHDLAGKRVLLTVGRLVTRKGIDMALRAVAMIARERPDLRYLIVGSGPERAALERIIADEGLAAVVTLVGAVSDQELVRYLQSCDLFLMPNRTLANGDTEGYGLVFREANACGKAVIGGRAGGAVEAVIDGVTGLLVDGHDVDAIADATRRLLDQPDLAAHCARQGLRLARAGDSAAVAAAFLTVCRRALDDDTPPR